MFWHQRRLALIRHTRAAIAEGICYGASDVPALPFDGDAEALIAEVAAWQPARIISSDFVRCRVLADALSGVNGVAVTLDPRLRELDFGEWEGMRWDDVPREALDRWATDPLGFFAPGGESGAALVARVGDFYGDLAAMTGRCAVVSHAGPIRVLMALAEGTPVDLLLPGPALGSVRFL
jgi:alpha-ribazole phosphatase